MNPVGRTLFLVLTLVLGRAVVAAPWAFIESPLDDVPGDFLPLQFSDAAADGFWVIGNGPNGRLAVRFDLAGNALARSANERFDILAGTPKRLADGGALLPGFSADPSVGCVLTRLAGDGTLLWSSRIPKRDNDDFERCARIEVDAGENIWVQLGEESFQRIAHLRMDGSLAGVIETAADFGRVTHVRADPTRAGVYLAGDRRIGDAGDQHSRAQIVRYGADHAIDWRWETTNPASDTGVLLMEVSAESGIMAMYSFFAAEDRGNAEANWVSVGLSLEGQPQFERNLHFDRPLALLQMSALDSQGAWVAIDDPGNPDQPAQVSVARLNLLGVLGSRRVIANALACRNLNCRLALRSDGGLWLAVAPASNFENPQLVGLAANGVERTRAEASNDVLTVLPDDRALTIVARQAPFPSLRMSFTAPPENWPDVSAILPNRLRLADSAIANDGGNAQLFQRYDGGGFLLRYQPGASAGAAWQVVLNGQARSAGQVSISDTLVCLATRVFDPPVNRAVASCWRRSNGSPFWTGGAEVDFESSENIIQALADGGVAILTINPGLTAVYRRIDATGQFVVEAPVPDFKGLATGISIAPDGTALVVEPGNLTNSRLMRRINRNGSVGFSVSVPSESFRTIARFAGDGSVLLFGSSVARYSANGQLLWRNDLSRSFSDTVIGNDTLWLSLSSLNAQPGHELMALDMATGQQRWRHVLSGDFEAPPQIELGAGNRLMVLQSQRSRLRWRVYDGADGTLLQEQTDGCAAVLCDLIRLRPGADGSALAWLDTFSAADGWGASLVRLPDAVADVGRIAADQDGVSGAWFAPWSNGQGLVIDWIAGARTLFAPWFTFSPSDPDTFFDYRTSADSDAANLHWFTLQGVVAPGATRADLALLSTDGGDFGVGIANARQVGDASLEFESCDRAHLRYRFNADVNAGAEGLVTLTRLTPGTPCVGTIGVAAAPKRFDASFEGSWFDPASSGQGLMFSVIPALDTLFATWFTYDPAAAPDEASEQHWFTLQGPLDDGEQTTLAIVRTLGGSFDELPTSNTQRVGTATVTRLACDRAELSYQFDDSEIAAAFRGINGSQVLSRIGGCE